MALPGGNLEAHKANLQKQYEDLQKLVSEKGDRVMTPGNEQFRAVDIMSDNRRRYAEIEEELGRRAKAQGRVQHGMEVGKDLVKSGSLGRATTGVSQGRIDENAIDPSRSVDMQDIIARRRENLEGMTKEEMQMSRDVGKEQIDRQTEGQRRRLQMIQAASGVRGGAAAAQQLQLMQGATQTRAEFERDLFMNNLQMKRQALNAFESSVTGAEAAEHQKKLAKLELQKFNIGQASREQELTREQERFNLQQAAREQQAQLATGLSIASMSASDEHTQAAIQAQVAAANAKSGGK